MKYLIAIFCLVLGISTGNAQEWVFGAGFSDFSDSRGTDDSMIAIEYHAAPFLDKARFSLGFAGAAEVHIAGDLYVGLGIAGVYQLNDRWFIEASVLPGYYRASSPQNDLGSDFEIRSLIGIGVALNPNSRVSVSVSVALAHKSNASFAPVNPGLNSILIRVRRRF